jgi:hypothetical protein
MKPLEILRDARAKIAEPDAWIKGDLARDIDGNVVEPAGADACQWCLEGALYAAAGTFPATPFDWDVYAAWSIVRTCAPTDAVYAFNDALETTHEEVLAVLDCAIARAEGR